MSDKIHKIVSEFFSNAGAEICDSSNLNESSRQWEGTRKELNLLLSHRNGFYGFGGALLVRPLSNSQLPCGIIEWNAQAYWKQNYDIDLSGLQFFAEDLFGMQFGIGNDGVISFNVETTEIKVISDNLVTWCRHILDEPAILTGYPLLEEWQRKYGPLAAGYRLVPKLPFVLGGRYDISNLVSHRDIDSIRFRASIANQIRQLPDGAEVKIQFDSAGWH